MKDVLLIYFIVMIPRKRSFEPFFSPVFQGLDDFLVLTLAHWQTEMHPLFPTDNRQSQVAPNPGAGALRLHLMKLLVLLKEVFDTFLGIIQIGI